ncbi:DUF5682 family protein [Oerskovia merdavium]|uniref:Uncharacterized protein n=1 Tax=Oerskovia merdavium TaxID=2762227 RepID=A0ABR8U2S1_9CELL|nr:DUF5682 family protein [Oerskovia merdavium]MBD7982336.1 hypothetical protein [Oerskovia merdavium]
MAVAPVPVRAAWGLAPERMRRAVAGVEALRDEGVYLAPVRHHSPACALAVEALLEEVRPAVVLIEGPEEYGRLLPALLDPRTRPPVAVLSLGTDGKGAGFYPLAEFSPEWVALRAADRLGAQVAFVDRSWAAREEAAAPGASDAPDAPDAPGEDEDDAFARTLQSERNLAHSRTVAAIAERLGCRDHDEVWDHLFEARTREQLTDWRELFDDVFAWAALARLDYEEEVLDADGSLAREALMSARVAEHRARVEGPVVVVTGAFHTLALVEALTGAPEGEAVVGRRPAGGYGDPAAADAWLIRYDHERLDGLRGYGAGMPSPGYYERLWAAHHDPAGPSALSTALLVDVAAAATTRGAQVSFAEVASAAEQARRLADLRERPWPGRTDLLDALTSCFVKDDGGLDLGLGRPLGQAVAEVFGGRALGEVPPGLASPPLVQRAREQAEALRLVVTDSTPRRTRLDARRTPRHRERRAFLALMDFVGSGFAHQVSGPDHVSGRGLGLLVEEWEYAWTPLVEASLVELSHQGATLEAVAVHRLHRLEHELATTGRSALGVARLVAQAVVLGLTDHLDRLVALLRSTLDVDPSLESVVGGLHRLVDLWDARVELGLDEHATELLDLVDHGLATAAYLVPGLGKVDADAEPAAVVTLVSLRDLLREVHRAGDRPRVPDDGARALADAPGTGGAPGRSARGVEPVRRELDRLREDRGTAPGVRGALVGLTAVDDALDDDVLVAEVRAQLSPGADPVAAVRFLGGLLRVAPDLLLHTPELFDAVHAGLRDLDEAAFLAVLPDLRRAFTWLKPAETHRLAQQVAERTGTRAERIDVHLAATEQDLEAGLALERELAAMLDRDGLGAWGGGTRHAHAGSTGPAADRTLDDQADHDLQENHS